MDTARLVIVMHSVKWMKTRKIVYKNLPVLAAIVLVVTGLIPIAAEATICRLVIGVEQSGGVTDPLNTVGESYNGTDICATNPTAGCDFSATDDVIRTHDIAVYRFSYSIIRGDAENVTIKTALPLGYTWEPLPGYCGSGSGSGERSGITGDGISAPSTMICNAGTGEDGASVDLLFNVRVLGDRADGATFKVAGEIAADDALGGDSCQDSDESDEVTVTAAPRLNLKKLNYSYYPYTHNGVQGARLVYKYRIGTVDIPLSGSAEADPNSPLTWIDDVSGISSNAELISCNAVRHGNAEPYRSLAIAPSGQRNRAVTDSGYLRCSQPGGAGAPINMSVTGADTSLSHYPTRSVNGSTLPVTEKIAAVGRIYIFVPLQDVLDAPGATLDARNCMTAFDPSSAAGVSNFGAADESEHDNCTNMAVIAGGYSWSKYFRRAPNSYDAPTTAAKVGSGDGVVSPDESWATLLAFYNHGIIDRPNVAYCDVIDINSYRFEPLAAGTADQISDVVTLLHNGYTGRVAVEYASGYVGTWPPPAGATQAVMNECNDPSVDWYPTLAAAGGPATVTKVRIRFLDDVPFGTYVYSWLNHKAIDNGNPNGHILENQATLYLDESPNGQVCSYDQGSYPGGHRFGGCGDRLMLTREIARVEKVTDDPAIPGIDNTVGSAVSGDQVKFWLLSSVTSIAATPPATDVIITDVLPNNMDYVSANPVPSSVLIDTPSPGETTLIWRLPSFAPNSPIDPIELDVAIDLDTPPGILTNSVCIESTRDGTEQRLRCDDRSIAVAVPAGLRVRKQVDKAYIDHDDVIQYELLWRNNSAIDISEMDIIDVIPYPGLFRNPTNEFSGTLTVIDPSVDPGLPVGVSVRYTNAAGQDISTDPTDASNLPGGSTRWCSARPSASAPQGCPTSWGAVTALRFLDSVTRPPLSPARSIYFKLKTDGNLTGDLYRNGFGAKGKETTLPVRSNRVISTVLGVAVGGTVFDDPENDGTFDSGAGTFQGIPVELYRIGRVPGTDAPIATTQTNARGNYIFDFLEPGRYFVFIPESGFPSDRLSSYLGAAANVVGDDADDDDDQVDDGELVRNQAGHTNGVRSADITLLEHREPTSEAVPNIATIHEDDRNNFTIDFGFTGLVAIGNRVFNDNGVGGGGANNGIIDGMEPPIDGVIVELYNASNAVIGSPLRTTITAMGGYYEFDRLRPGEYFVRIPRSNFSATGPLTGMVSSTGAGADDGVDDDVDENGLDDFVAGGVNSMPIDLRDGREVVDEDQSSYSGSLVDENVDFSIDFAFVQLASVGSRVWDDTDGDGEQDADEAGVPGVCVSLIAVGADGIIGSADDEIVGTQTTGDGRTDVDGDGTVDPIGYYYFINVMPGEYYLEFSCLPPSATWSPPYTTNDPASDSDVDEGGRSKKFILSPGEDDDTRDAGLFNPTTPVQFMGVKIEFDEARSQAIFRFKTSMEDGAVGFDLYGRTTNRWRKLNRNIVRAKAADSGRDGADYAIRVNAKRTDEFAIVEVDMFTSNTLHGPYKASIQYGRFKVEAESTAFRRSGQAPSRVYRKADGRRVNRLWALTRDEGIYRLGHAELVAAGLDLTGVDINAIALTHRGQATPRHIGGGTKKFSRNSFIEFFAEDVKSLYTRENVYEISINPRKAKRAHQSFKTAASAANVATKLYSLERDRHYSRLAPGSDPWYMDRLLATDGSRSKTYRFTLDAGINERTKVRVGIFGATEDPSVRGDHHVAIRVNGALVGSRVFEGVMTATIEANIPKDVLLRGTNRLTIEVPNDRGAKFDLIYVDNIAIEYLSLLRVQNGSLDFVGAKERYRIEEGGSKAVSVWSRSQSGARRHALQRRNNSILIASDGRRREFSVVAANAIKTPKLVKVHRAQKDDAPVDYLVIAHPAFINSDLERLVSARQAEGYRTRVESVVNIYGSHAGGIVDPRAIATYIKNVARNNGARYVLLVGDDSYDPFGRLGVISDSYLPTLYERSDRTINWTPADGLLADIDNDGVQDLAIGRLPVTSAAELSNVVNKTLLYADAAPVGTAFFSADDTDDASLYSFKRDSERLRRILGSNWSTPHAYLDDHELSKARARLVNVINRGVSLVNYVGHSDLNTWGFDGVFRGNDLPKLTNRGLPTIFLQWGCWNTYFVEPRKQVLGVEAMTRSERGAAAVVGASSLVRAVSERELGRLLFKHIEAGELTLGEAILRSKQALARRYPDKMKDIRVNFTLLGDPALRIPVPEAR